MAEPEKDAIRRNRWLTWGNFLWMVIALMLVLTILAMIWASKQPPIHSEPGPPLS